MTAKQEAEEQQRLALLWCKAILATLEAQRASREAQGRRS